jgi:phage tail-like protein
MAFNPTGVRNDPFKGYNFLIKLLDSSSQLVDAPTPIENGALGGFSECSGLEMTLEVEPYQEGGNNGTVRQFPTRITWGNIRLKRGVVLSDELWEWHYGFVEGKGKRRDGLIVLRNDQHEPVKAWQFTRGLPAKWTGPTMDATQNQVAVEELEIAHEGLKLVPPGAAPAASNSTFPVG